MNGLGLVSGLATAALWTATAICFEVSARRIGSFAVNILRLLVAALLFTLLSIARTGHLYPRDLSESAWFDLSLSGLIGFVVADLMLFQAFVLIGARRTTLIYASVPAMTSIAGYVALGEQLSPRSILGMVVTSAGICLAIVGKRVATPKPDKYANKGVLLALGASAGQAAGLLLGKRGAGTMDAFSATQIRVIAGLCGFCLIGLVAGRLRPIAQLLGIATGIIHSATRSARSVRVALGILTVGAVLGPFLGVSLGLLSTQLLPAGIASTLMSLMPVLLIPVSVLAFHERVTSTEIGGTLIALVGVALLV
jgi:drug/metabolite transporter (DMT)-like permease